MTIDTFNKLTSHLQAHAPVLITKILAGFLRNVIAEIHHYGNLRQAPEEAHWHRDSGTAASQPVNLGRHFTLWENIYSRLISSHCLYLRILHRSHPTREATCRMGDEYGRVEFLHQSVDGGDVLRMVANIRCHLAEELAQIG